MPVFLNREENTEKQYYVTDSHGNVVQLTDANGKVAKIYEYDSFGNEMKPDEKDDNPFRYCGEYYDKETEEIYLRARYYQPVLGRFLTRDSYTGEDNDPLTLHLYTYCEGDGINQIDPSGHWGKNIHFGLTKVIAKALGFSKQDAYLIAKGCIGADKWTKKSGKWKLIIKNIPVSGRKKKEKIIIKESDISNSLKMYKSRGTGKDFHGFKPDLHTVNKNFYKAIKMGEKIALSVGMKNTKKRMKKMALIGLWLHARQDRYAHGLKKEKIKHVGKTDNIKYDYDYEVEEPYKVRNGKTEKVLPFKRVKKWKENRRLKRTVNRTKEYLLDMKSIIMGYPLVEINSSEQEQKDVNKAINNYFKNH